MRTCDTQAKRPIPPLTLCRRIRLTTESQPYIHCNIYTVDHTFSYYMKNFTCASKARTRIGTFVSQALHIDVRR